MARKKSATARNAVQTVRAYKSVKKGIRATGHSLHAASENIPAAIRATQKFDFIVAKENMKFAGRAARGAISNLQRGNVSGAVADGLDAFRHAKAAYRDSRNFRRKARAAYGSVKAVAQRGKNGVLAGLRTAKAAERTVKSARNEYGGGGRGASNASKA